MKNKYQGSVRIKRFNKNNSERNNHFLDEIMYSFDHFDEKIKKLDVVRESKKTSKG